MKIKNKLAICALAVLLLTSLHAFADEEKVTQVFAVIQEEDGVNEYYANVMTFDSNTGLANLESAHLDTNANPQYTLEDFNDVPPIRVASYPCGLPHVGPHRPGVQNAMNCIYMPDATMANWQMGIFLSENMITNEFSCAITDDNGGITSVIIPEIQPAQDPSFWIPLNIGHTSSAIKTWFADPANYGPIVP